MIAGFKAGIVDMVVLDDVSTPGSIPNANASTRHIVDLVMGNCNPFGPRNIDPGNLLPKNTTVVDQVVFNAALYKGTFFGIQRWFLNDRRNK